MRSFLSRAPNARTSPQRDNERDRRSFPAAEEIVRASAASAAARRAPRPAVERGASSTRPVVTTECFNSRMES